MNGVRQISVDEIEEREAKLRKLNRRREWKGKPDGDDPGPYQEVALYHQDHDLDGEGLTNQT